MNPAEWLTRTASRTPEAPALLEGTERRATYAEFAKSAAAIAAALKGHGVAKGDRVALFAGNSTRYLEALYGVWWAGAAAVPINAKLHEREAVWMLENSGASFVFSDDKSAAALAPLLPDSVVLVLLESAEFDAMRLTAPLGSPVPLKGEDLAWLFYTSGTTGKPKGVMLTCGNLASMALTYFADVDDVKPQDAALYAAPMSHGAGLYNFMHVIKGARHVVPRSGGFDAEEILSIAPLIGSISMFAAPTMVRRLVDAAKAGGGTGKGLRTIVYAGGPMYEADILEAVEVMGARFVQIYGQGECPMGITALARHEVADRSHRRWRERLNSVGTAQSVVRVAIVDDAGAELPRGAVGEIVVEGPTVMAGYWRNPDATAATLKNGWLWTGDMGRMDEDGYVTLQDRSKDVIISGGSNIYPREVEEVLLAHPAVHESAVIGKPDAEWGEVVVAFIACHPGQSVTEAALNALCLDNIARFKRPKIYRFVKDLPKNNYGKILKTELRKDIHEEEPA
ncbi:AMP-binding protein [Roseibium sediminicola]|uniref:AMP-binding protein n=1 Tax=Roseibium sediminicola TaxID=2933272 RepID=A0ABT0H191_9HYPH|nr:AMP-binding protein [Roseibium sp. CAU 1639]MCK7614833.1 AMP-binding protein [Roseibium sp. CAU 1639]